MIKKQIKKQDIVSLQSLSGGMAGDRIFKPRYKIGKERIKQIGLVPKEGPNSLKGSQFISNNPDARAEDFMEAINDKEVKLIIANIGGFDSHRIIPYLNKKEIIKNPKPILGYSDITSLHLFMYTLGIQTYYGPSVLDGFAENVAMHDLTKASLEKILFTNKDQLITSSNYWTSEFLDWANRDYEKVSRKMILEKEGHIWHGFSKNISGHLIGGCLDTIYQIKDEAFFPNIECWKNSVIFLETSEMKMEPLKFKESLLKIKDEIKVAQAVIFGKPKDEMHFKEYLEIAKEILKIPFIFNINFGHTAPIYTIPYGGKISLDWNEKLIIINK